jgi:MFS family permease
VKGTNTSIRRTLDISRLLPTGGGEFGTKRDPTITNRLMEACARQLRFRNFWGTEQHAYSRARGRSPEFPDWSICPLRRGINIAKGAIRFHGERGLVFLDLEQPGTKLSKFDPAAIPLSAILQVSATDTVGIVESAHELGPRRGHVWSEAWSLLRRNRDFRLFYIAQLISYAGDWFLIVALSGLVLDLTGSAALVAGVFVAYNLPFGVVAFIGGPLADRMDRRLLMIVTNAAMGILALGFFLVHTRSELWLVYVLTAGISAVSALFEPAASAAIPNLVDPPDLAPANMLTGSAWGTMLAVGAGVGGLVVAAYGNDAGYAIDAISFFVAGGLLLGVRRATSEAREPHDVHPNIVEATREALRYSRRDHRLMALFAVRLGAGFALGLVALLPVLAISVFHAGDRGTGLLFAFRGIGSVIGPFLIWPFVRRGRRRRLLAAVIITPAVFAAMYGLLPWMPSLYLAGFVAVLAHLAGGAQYTLVAYTYQSIVPDRILGRIFGFDGALLTFTLSASNALCGWLAGILGVREVMTGLATTVILYTALVWVVTRKLRHGPVPPRN